MEISEKSSSDVNFWARTKDFFRLDALFEERDDAESVLSTLARTIEAKDRYTLGHGDRVSQFAMDLGKSLGVNGTDLDTLRKGGLLHDIGKIAIPDSILLKPGKFSDDEFSFMKKHPAMGCDICRSLKSVRAALPLIRNHHERLNGTGYPDGLNEKQIPPLVRVISIVDIYDALRSERAYKEAFSIDKSFQVMWGEVANGWWDKNVLEKWEDLIRSKKN